MGLVDFVKKNYEEQKNRYQENAEKNRQLALEYAKQTHCNLVLTAGMNHIMSSNSSVMHQRPDGSIYFNYNRDRNYKLISYNWNGPLYNSITNSNTTGTEIKKGKGGKIVAGAAVGSLINSVGALVGAAAGAGSKGVKNIKSNTISNTQNVEVPTPASIKLRCIETNEIFGIAFNCTSELDAKLKLFNYEDELPSEDVTMDNNSVNIVSPVSDNLEQIKKLKELLDLGAITPAEFDEQKMKLLS